MKSLSSEIGISISDIRRILGRSSFDELIDQAYGVSANNPEAGAELVREKILGEHGVEFGRGIGSQSDKRRQ
jgi:hypothetical protein